MRLAIDLKCTDLSRGKVVAFTSALPGEGKSTTAAAFGLHVAKTGAKTVLIDLDFRNPSLSRIFAGDMKNTVVGVLTGACKLQDALWLEPNSNMDFLPSPTGTTVANTTELISSSQMKQLVDQLRARYEYVIVDLPPLNPLIDARAAAKSIDGYFLIVEWGETSSHTVRRALSIPPNVAELVIGVVLNKADFKLLGKFDSELVYSNPDPELYGFRA